MPCCWAGSNGEFSIQELSRAICIYITILVFSPIAVLVVSYLVKTRKNFEMQIREPIALLVMVILLWTYVLCQDMHHLFLDLEKTDYEVWADFNEDRYYLSKIGVISYLGGMTAFFYRGWMFWFKSRAGREATAYLFVPKYAPQEELIVDELPKNLSLRRRATILPIHPIERRKSTFSNRRQQLANPKIVGGVLAIFFLFTITIHIVIQDRKEEHEHRIWIWGLVFFVIGSVEVYLLRNVDDNLGTLMEYKVVTFLAVLQWLILLVIEFSGKSYWILLVELEVQTLAAIGCIIWLRYHIGSFNVDKGKEPCSDVSLKQVLSDPDSFQKFVQHTKEHMCVENLAFFIDMYALRKTLQTDPFIVLTEDERGMIRECARMEMKWIDESISLVPDNVPSATDIFELYIPCYSEMEVNIPGPLRKKLVKEFEDLPPEEYHQYRLSLSIRPKRVNKVDKESTRIIFGPEEPEDTTKQEELVTKLYPVWRTLLSLLNSDTLVRYLGSSPGAISQQQSNCRLGYTPGSRAQEDEWFGSSSTHTLNVAKVEMCHAESSNKGNIKGRCLSAKAAF
jgi:hypothetical protein